MATSDRALWQEAVGGSPVAFGELYERHARVVYNYCFRRTGDWAISEDLTSAVFLEAWRRRGEIEAPDDSLVPWLLGVATNLVRNQRRATRRYQSAMDGVPPWRSDPDFAEEIDNRLDAESRMRSILTLVGRLSQKEQEILALCAWMGLSYEEVARALGIPVGTVRSRLSRARSRLRELSGPDGHEQGEAGTGRVPSAGSEREDHRD